MTDDHYPYLPRRSVSEALLNELRSLGREMQNLREVVQTCSLSGEMDDLCKAVQGLGLIPKDDDDSPYLPPRSASKALLDKLSNLRDEVRDAAQKIAAAQKIDISGPLVLILIVLAVQTICLFVLARDIHYALHPSLS